ERSPNGGVRKYARVGNLPAGCFYRPCGIESCRARSCHDVAVVIDVDDLREIPGIDLDLQRFRRKLSPVKRTTREACGRGREKIASMERHRLRFGHPREWKAAAFARASGENGQETVI